VIGKVLAAVLRGMISSSIIVLLAFLFGAHFTLTPLFLLVPGPELRDLCRDRVPGSDEDQYL
jgi:hypothetical protein